MGNPEAAVSQESGRPRCGAHGKTKKQPCGNPAGYRTTHLGVGRCWLHAGRPIVHGRYSTLLRALAKKEHETLYRALLRDPNVESLVEEVSLLRVMLAAIPQIVTDRHNQALAATQLVEAIGRTVVRMVQVTYAKGYRLTESQLTDLAAQMVNAVAKNVADPAALQGIRKDFLSLGLPLDAAQAGFEDPAVDEIDDEEIDQAIDV